MRRTPKPTLIPLNPSPPHIHHQHPGGPSAPPPSSQAFCQDHMLHHPTMARILDLRRQLSRLLNRCVRVTHTGALSLSKGFKAHTRARPTTKLFGSNAIRISRFERDPGFTPARVVPGMQPPTPEQEVALRQVCTYVDMYECMYLNGGRKAGWLREFSRAVGCSTHPDVPHHPIHGYSSLLSP